jgi:outer membrane protein
MQHRRRRAAGYLATILLALAASPRAAAQERPASAPAAATQPAVSQPAASQPASQPTGARPLLRLRVQDVTRLVSTNNTDLRVAYYNHLIERTRITEAQARFDPVAFSGVSGGTDEAVFASLFPTGMVDPAGEPTFFQAIVTDSSDVWNANAGVRGILPTGATYELRTATDYRDRDRGGAVNPSLTSVSTLTVNQPLLRMAWLQYNQAPIEQARNLETMARQRYRSDVLVKIFEVEQAYWEHVFAVRNLEVKRQSLEVANRLLEINRVKVRTGVFAPIEVVSAEAGVASRETEVIVAENEIQNRADGLRRLILPFETIADWNVDIESLDAPDGVMPYLPTEEECAEIAFKERPDLAEQRLNLRNLAIDVAVADNETMPRLDLAGQVGYTGLDTSAGNAFTDSFGQNGGESWNVGVIFELPIGNASARARLARSRLTRDQAIMSYRSLRVTVVEAVRRAYRNVHVARRTIESLKKATELSQEELKNERVKFDNGRSTNFEVLRVEDDLSQRRSDLLRAYANFRISLAELAAAMGSSVEVLNWIAPAR